jgi:DNA-directed RNA polymerase specialized sigma24 family protein
MDTLTKADLHAAMRARKVADARYDNMIRIAKEEGWTNSEIARAVGVSEAAIRLWLVRHPSDQVVTTELVAS